MKAGSVILAGGKASRMGDADKAFVKLASKPLLAHVIARLGPQVSDIVISANGDLSRYASFGLPVIGDSLGEFAGPLAGVLAGLEWHAKNWPDISYVVSVPVDAPFFPMNLVARLRAVANHQRKPVVACSESGVHPVIGLWPVEIAQDLSLDEGVRKVGAWTERRAAIEVTFPPVEVSGKPLDPFFNINRPEDLAEAEALLKTD